MLLESSSTSALDARARRLAAKSGYRAVKSRRYRPPDVLDGYQIVDSDTGFPVAGWKYDYSAQDVIDWLQRS